MKIIDLFNDIANNKEMPKMIKISNYIYHFDIDESKYIRFINDDLENPRGLLEDINLYNAYVWFNLDVGIIEEKPEKIEKLTLNGKTIGFGIMKEWMDFTPNDNEQKICSAIESVGINQNKIIKAVNYLLEKSDKE